MTNEQLIRQYYDGDEAALEKLYYKNIGLIRGIAKETAAEFNCLTANQHHPNQFSAYTKTILDDLCGEGALEFLTRIQSREYDESRAETGMPRLPTAIPSIFLATCCSETRSLPKST